MLKKIDVNRLKLGMHIHDLNCAWTQHPFVRGQFKLSSRVEIEKIIDAGIQTLTIDTDKGLDDLIVPGIAHGESEADLERKMIAIATSQPPQTARLSFTEETLRAKQIKMHAYQTVQTVMRDARLGKTTELEVVETVVRDITESILRNPSALIGLLRIKDKDDYTFLHSVSVCTLLVAFCRSAGMAPALIYQAGLGGLLHDTGKALVPDAVLNKPGPLTSAEYDIIKKHPQDGHEILSKIPGIGPIPLEITLHHHERSDGTGYPDRQPGASISPLSQMAAIVDVYDAITADRCYRQGMPAAEALRKMLEWSKFQFNPDLVQSFIRCIGIYPVGTLVRLESGRLAVVLAPHETNLLAPKVNAIFSTKSNTYIKPEVIDLSKPLGLGGGDKIVSHESPATWNINPLRFMGEA